MADDVQCRERSRDPLEKTLEIEPNRNVNFMYVDNAIGQRFLELH